MWEFEPDRSRKWFAEVKEALMPVDEERVHREQG